MTGTAITFDPSSNLPLKILMAFVVVGIVALFMTLGFLSPNIDNPDNANEIKKNLGIISVVLAIIVGILGIVTYMYFTANIAYITQFTIVMLFVNLFVSLFALSASTLNARA
jgi:uncharacterized membrane protein